MHQNVSLRTIGFMVIFTAGIFTGFAQQPNIIFIYADDWGYGDLSLHGHQILTTPNLDRLAEEGSEFLQFNVCNPVCSPSRAAIMTGQYPARHHVHQHFANHQLNMDRNMPDWLDPSVTTLPRLLKENGYRTAHFGKWHLTSAKIENPPLTASYGYDMVRNWHGEGPKVEGPRGESTGTCVDYCMAFMEGSRGNPFFINLWIHESHAAIDPPQDAIDEYAHVEEPYRSYYACISYADRELGRLFQYLKDEGLDSTTLVIFTSDNGPEYPSSDPDALSYYSRGETAGLIGQKRSLFEGGVGLPFIAHWPGTVPAGKVNNTTHLAAVDILPSLCRIAGVELPADYESDGEDLSENLLGGDQPRTRPVFWDWRGSTSMFGWPRNAVRSGDWKLLCNEDGSEKKLYNIQASRVESSDSASLYPELTDSLFLMLSNWKESLPRNIPLSPIRFYTNQTGDQVFIDFSALPDTLSTVIEPELRLFRSEKLTEIPIDSITHDTRKIYLHLQKEYPLLPDDQLSIAFRSGEITAGDRASLLFFSTEAVENRVQSGPDLFSLGFRIVDASNDFRLPGASLQVDTLMGLTNTNGEAYFQLSKGNYLYAVHKDNYTSLADTLIIYKDTLVLLYLHPTLASVKFRTSDGTLPLGQVDVEIGGITKQTNVVGITLFENLNIGEQYAYRVTKSGYEQMADAFFLDIDTTVQVIMTPLSTVSSGRKAQVVLYPNPCKGTFFIQSKMQVQSLEIYSLQGKLLKVTANVGGNQVVDISEFGKGYYVLKLIPEDKDRSPLFACIQYI